MSTLSASARWTFRLHRWALIVWAALVVVGIGLLLWLAGPLTDEAARAWRLYDTCRTASCDADDSAFMRYLHVSNLLSQILLGLPFLVAGWAGASLTGRDMESGTASLAWTQAATPARWLASRLAAAGAPVAVGAACLVALHRYAWSVADGRVGVADRWWQLQAFYGNGPVIVTLCLAALATGVLTGLVVRRVLPALGISLVLTALLFTAAHWLMPHLWTPVTEISRFQDGYRGLYTGVELSHGLVTRTGAHLPTPECHAHTMDVCRRIYEQHGGTGFYVTFHPASHYWPLQLTTTALLLLVTALLTAASFVVLRRRTG
ncbi:hypothetical protein EV284_5775 [Streptomyces sp. BK022]|uniref:ABC transporter permease n=1 Tax=Streptomyces sp. BK022 TaxID=2512123 RepID=UPI00102883BA|nr:ABC transporter permease [Streptomyces sp. BK022]RZU29551.1 hypothetical protein EV284_5775 [Streptomyces sp. BK022]